MKAVIYEWSEPAMIVGDKVGFFDHKWNYQYEECAPPAQLRGS